MSQSISEQNSPLPDVDHPRVRFGRYARGRIAHFWARQILTGIGSAYLALMTSPMVGISSGLIALFGELVDCTNLRHQLNAIERGKPFHLVSLASSITAAFQSVCISICVLMASR